MYEVLPCGVSSCAVVRFTVCRVALKIARFHDHLNPVGIGRVVLSLRLCAALWSSRNVSDNWHKAHKTLYSHHDAIYVVDAEGSAAEQPQVLPPSTQWLRYLFRHDFQEYIKKSHPHQGHRGSVAHIPSERRQWQRRGARQGVHLCKGHGQNNLNLAEEILCATEDPHKSGNTLHQQKKIGNATQGFFVEFKERSKHCSSLVRGTVIHISVESWQSRAQLRYFFKAQWPTA